MDLPLLCAFFAVFAIALYVLLDGFDLGVGALLLMQREERLRNQMVDSILPTWDGNETWLIMAAITLLAAFPIAYGVLLPAFYVPLVLMLLALGLRGVSFEFRSQAGPRRPLWDAVFGFGSIVAPLMQGVTVGGLLQGVAVRGEGFGGEAFDVFSPLSGLLGVTLLAGDIVLGAGWLHLKGADPVRRFAESALRHASPLFSLLAVAVCVLAARTVSAVAAAWSARGPVLALLSVGFVVGSVALRGAIGRRPDALPFVLGLVLFALGLAGFGLTVFPEVVPFRLSIWASASAHSSQLAFLLGASVVAPVVIAYSAFAYRVFRGRTPLAGWDA